MNKGAKLVASALLGMDKAEVMINGKTYEIQPPTIKRLVGAGYYLAGFGDVANIAQILASIQGLVDATKAISWFVIGDDSLSEELQEGTLEEIVTALETCVKLIDVRNFMMLSALSKNVGKTIAKPRS